MPMGELRVGTSGYAYKEWKGSFYPAKFPDAKMLEYYAARFSTVEINYTFYRLPSAKTLEAWIPQTPEGFTFALKATQKITHILRLRNTEDMVKAFVEGAQPLVAAGRLGPVLFQLPPNFKADVPLLDDFLASLPQALRAAVEFRHATWFTDPTYDCLRRHRAALCIAETEEGHPPLEITAVFAYFRLRKELYTDADLGAWRDRFEGWRAAGHDLYVYFKHEDKGTAPAYAGTLVPMKNVSSAP
jgi:uncharacterized protein YecE (DUF72 family)